MNHCETCRWRDDKGFCRNEKLTEDEGQNGDWKDDALIYSYSEGGGFWVGPRFGCVHWEEIV